MVAVAALSHGWQAALYGVAVVCFIVATFNANVRVNLIAAGLALATFVLFWNAVAAA